MSRVAQGNDEYALVLEDDSVPTDKYLQGLYSCIKDAPDFDIIHMVVLRPEGDDMKKRGLLKVRHGQKLDPHRLPNIWLCSYLLSKSGASKLLDLFKKKKFDLNNEIIDRALVYATNDSPEFSRYVVKHRDYFVHDETDSDRRTSNPDRRVSNPNGPIKCNPILPLALVLVLILFLLLVRRR